MPPRRAKSAGTYFVATRTWESREIFRKPMACEVVIDTILQYREQGKYLLHSFVLMPDHLHVILTPPDEITLERAVQFVKGASSRRIFQELGHRFPIWQRGYTDHRIRNAQDYATHPRYIEANPVKAGLVSSAAEYPWSSASQHFVMNEPQGLKPLSSERVSGTVETVPYVAR